MSGDVRVPITRVRRRARGRGLDRAHRLPQPRDLCPAEGGQGDAPLIGPDARAIGAPEDRGVIHGQEYARGGRVRNARDRRLRGGCRAARRRSHGCATTSRGRRSRPTWWLDAIGSADRSHTASRSGRRTRTGTNSTRRTRTLPMRHRVWGRPRCRRVAWPGARITFATPLSPGWAPRRPHVVVDSARASR